MTVYQILINMGAGYVAVSEVLVSESEAKRICADVHPALNPVVRRWRV